jgi:hypothetical protein
MERHPRFSSILVPEYDALLGTKRPSYFIVPPNHLSASDDAFAAASGWTVTS